MIVEVRRILDKKRADRAVMPEEYTTLSRFVQMVEQRQLDQREIGRARRKKAMEKVRHTLPAFAFEVPLKELDLPDSILQALKNVESVGDLMLRLQADTDKLQEVLTAAKVDEDGMDVIRDALTDFTRTHREPEPVAAAIEELAAELPAPVPEPEAVVAAPIAEATVVEEEEEAPPAFVDAVPQAPFKAEDNRPRMRKVPKVVEPAEPAEAVFATEDGDNEDPDKKGDKKGKNRRRELVFDEDRGQVVAKRKRKGGRDRSGWDVEE